jgi:hypothetical protein
MNWTRKEKILVYGRFPKGCEKWLGFSKYYSEGEQDRRMSQEMYLFIYSPYNNPDNVFKYLEK